MELNFSCTECGKSFKSEKSLRAHNVYHNLTTEQRIEHNALRTANLRAASRACVFCERNIGASNIKKHERLCYLNPVNKTLCDVCESPIKNYTTSKTCGYSCANKKFKTGKNNGNWKTNAYRTTCFHYHEKKCIICAEDKIVEVHHYDGNHFNNAPENLVPLCPTHHQYWHSKFKSLVQDEVDSYVTQFKNKGEVN